MFSIWRRRWWTNSCPLQNWRRNWLIVNQWLITRYSWCPGKSTKAEGRTWITKAETLLRKWTKSWIGVDVLQRKRRYTKKMRQNMMVSVPSSTAFFTSAAFDLRPPCVSDWSKYRAISCSSLLSKSQMWNQRHKHALFFIRVFLCSISQYRKCHFSLRSLPPLFICSRW